MNNSFINTENHNNFLDTKNFKYLINFVFNDIKQKTNNDISNNSKYISIFKRLVQIIHEKNMNKRVTKEYLNNLVIDKCVPFIIKQLNKENNNNNSRFLQQNPLGISQRPMASGQRPGASGQRPGASGQRPMSSGQRPNNDFSHLTLDNSNHMTNNVVNNIGGIASRNGERIDYATRLTEFQEERGYNDGSGRPTQLKSVNEIIGANTNDEEKIDYIKKMQELQNERNYDNQNTSMNDFQQSTNIENIINNEQLQEVNNQNVEIDNSFLQQLYENNTNADTNIDVNSLNKLSNNYLDNENIDDAYENVNNLRMNIIDKSEQNKLPDYDSNIDNLKSEIDLIYVNFPFIKLLTYPFSWVMPLFLIALISITMREYMKRRKR